MWLKNEFVVLNSGKSLCSRGSFPECILEDSGFEEPQEFRTRCSSLAGSLQRKPGEGVIMGPPRRRHSSAPNHVQPSNAEKNRTMLFQVHTTKKLHCEITCFLSLCPANWLLCWWNSSRSKNPVFNYSSLQSDGRNEHRKSLGECIFWELFCGNNAEFTHEDFIQMVWWMCFLYMLKTIFFLKEPDSQCPAKICKCRLFHTNARTMSFAFLLAFISAADSLAAANHFYAHVVDSFKAQHNSALCCCYSLKRL